MEQNIPGALLLIYKVLFLEYTIAQQETTSLFAIPRPHSTMFLVQDHSPKDFPLSSSITSTYLSIQTTPSELHSPLQYPFLNGLTQTFAVGICMPTFWHGRYYCVKRCLFVSKYLWKRNTAFLTVVSSCFKPVFHRVYIVAAAGSSLHLRLAVSQNYCANTT